ncbi:hypothetical protein JCM15764A_21400 [Geotalea toluenoxydans]
MILQCDQCNTKFKLDDAKIKEGGVKVRCSKCRHVFLVTKEPQEETDFDAILGGLDATPPPPAAPAQAGDRVEAENAGAAGPQNSFSQLKQMLAEPDSDEKKQEESMDEEGFDFSDFNFNEEQKPAPQAEREEVVKSYDLSGFNPDEDDTSETTFTDTSIADNPEIASSEAAPQEENRFEFDFEGGTEPEPAAKIDSQPPEDAFGYKDFSFTEESLSSDTEAASDSKQSGEFDFNDFTFDAEDKQAEHAPVADTGNTAPGPGAGVDFDSFDFEAAEDSPEAPAGLAAATDFEAATSEPFISEMELDLTEKGPDEQLHQAQPPALPDSDGNGEFAFDFGDGSGDENLPPAASPAAASAADNAEVPDIPEFSFGDLQNQPFLATSPAEQAAGKSSAVGEIVEEGRDQDFAAIDFGQVAPSAAAPEETQHQPLLHDLVGGDKKETPLSGSQPEFSDEYPPLSISSRRKNNSFFTFAGLGIFLLVLLGLAGTGIFFLKNWPEAFNKVGLGSIVQRLGIKSAEEGHIGVRNPVGAFVVNKEAGELFVITGVAVNEYRKPRASIQVKASLFGKNGAIAMQKVAYCGNNLSKEQLESMPMEKLEAAMNNQFGDSLSNLGIQPGKEIPFVVIFSKVPQDTTEFGVEVVGSTVAGQ